MTAHDDAPIVRMHVSVTPVTLGRAEIVGFVDAARNCRSSRFMLARGALHSQTMPTASKRSLMGAVIEERSIEAS